MKMGDFQMPCLIAGYRRVTFNFASQERLQKACFSLYSVTGELALTKIEWWWFLAQDRLEG